jgi:ankyrin repeat protein
MNPLYLCAFRNIMTDDLFETTEKISVLEECIANGMDINYNHSQILIDALNTDYEIIKFLIDNNIDIHTNNKILIRACFSNDLKVLDLLFSAGLDPAKSNNYIIKHYFRKYSSGAWIELDTLKLLVEYGVDPCSHNNALLKIACKEKDYDYAEYLFSMGASCCELNSACISELFNSPGNLEIKKLFLDNNMDLHISNTGVLLPLEYSILLCDLNSCNMLIAYGADINLCYNIINAQHDIIANAFGFVYADPDEIDQICKLFAEEYAEKIRAIFERKKSPKY